MPAMTFSFTHFRVQYNRPARLSLKRLGVVSERFCSREPPAEILSALCEGPLSSGSGSQKPGAALLDEQNEVRNRSPINMVIWDCEDNPRDA